MADLDEAREGMLAEIERRRQLYKGAAPAIGEINDLIQPSPQENIEHYRVAQTRQPLTDQQRMSYTRYLKDIANLTGSNLSDGELRDAAYNARQADYGEVEKEWLNRTGNKLKLAELRATTPRPVAPTDIGQIVREEEKAATDLLESGIGRQRGVVGPVNPAQIKLATALRLARTYADRFPATTSILNSLNKAKKMAVAQRQNPDEAMIAYAENLLGKASGPPRDQQANDARAMLRADPYAQQVLQSLVRLKGLTEEVPRKIGGHELPFFTATTKIPIPEEF